MTQSPSEAVNLLVEGPDAATEIFLIDAGLQRIEAGIGELRARVAPGLYKIRYRSGAQQEDTLVHIPAGKANHVISARPVLFRSAAPIANTETSHEYQAWPALDHSRRTHHAIGHGSHVFLFVREASEDEHLRVCDVAVYDLHGQRLAGIDVGFSDEKARVAAANVELDPGTYAVRVTNPTIGSYEMFVTASPGWQTQAFFTCEDFWKRGKRVRAPSIRQSSLLMASQHQGFDPSSELTRTSELARQALAQGRDVISDEILNQMLHGKFQDPLLGIIGAHLLLRRTQRATSTVRLVCQNLRMMLGEHPDVVAVELALDRGTRRTVEKITAPPTLRDSWKEITKATRRKASLVPPDGVVARIGQNIVRAGLWLTRRVPDAEQLTSSTTTIAGAVRLAGQLISQNPETLVSVARDAQSTRNPLSSIEQAVLNATISAAEIRSRSKGGEATEALVLDLANKALLSQIAAPTYVVASAVESLANRLKMQV